MVSTIKNGLMPCIFYLFFSLCYPLLKKACGRKGLSIALLLLDKKSKEKKAEDVYYTLVVGMLLLLLPPMPVFF